MALPELYAASKQMFLNKGSDPRPEMNDVRPIAIQNTIHKLNEAIFKRLTEACLIREIDHY
jgi:hypothetical protein